ncbi:MAG: hypothetical protein ABIC57_00930 [bacterium]
MDKITSNEEDSAFFKEHNFEIIAQCMQLQPDTTGMNEELRGDTQIEAMNEIAKKYKYGPFRHLCESCKKEAPTCDVVAEEDIMFGWGPGDDNVCKCEKYEPREVTDERECTIKTEATNPG